MKYFIYESSIHPLQICGLAHYSIRLSLYDPLLNLTRIMETILPCLLLSPNR